MPDTTIPLDTLSSQSDASRAPLVTAAYMRGLWDAYEVARDAYREEDEERTGAAVTEAQERILGARTVEPEGIAIKLKLVVERDGDCPMKVLKATIQDLTETPRAPSLAELAKSLAEAARPHVEEGGGITSRADLVDALAPLIGHYTIADAVCMIGFLRTAAAVFSEDGCDDALFAVTSILEDFASLGEAADADSAAARAHLIEKSSEDDCWDLGTANLKSATRHAASDMRAMQKGTFQADCFGGTFVHEIQMPGWLYHAIQNTEGDEAGSEYASIYAARAQTYQQAAE